MNWKTLIDSILLGTIYPYFAEEKVRLIPIIKPSVLELPTNKVFNFVTALKKIGCYIRIN